MNRILEACKDFALRAYEAGRSGLRIALHWLSFPINACFAALATAFLVSFLSWAIADRRAEIALFFPAGSDPAKSSALRGELRDLPRPRGAEARAELVASELLLGPRDPKLHPAFPQDSRLESAIYRKGRLYIDISEDAALEDPAALKLGLKALRRSIRAAFPGLRSLTVTIGGREPYADFPEAGNGAKKQKNN
jgi:hypothetical protein